MKETPIGRRKLAVSDDPKKTSVSTIPVLSERPTATLTEVP